MTSLIGHAAAQAAFEAALNGPAMPHGWLIAGPEGVGKATFAEQAAVAILVSGRGVAHDPEAVARIASNVATSSDPDFCRLTRVAPKKDRKPEPEPEDKSKLARSIKVEQVRDMLTLLHTRPTEGSRRVILVDAADDLEAHGANALLKALEEPPDGTFFLLVSHSPGRLLPTIRSRCRLLRLEALNDEEVARVIRAAMPDLPAEEVAALVAVGEGSPGRALGFAGLDLGALTRDMAAVARTGDPDNAIRNRLAKLLSGKAAQPRYEAFMTVAPGFIAAQARARSGPALIAALDAYRDASALSGAALGLSLDVAGSVFEMAGLIAHLAPTQSLQTGGRTR